MTTEPNGGSLVAIEECGADAVAVVHGAILKWIDSEPFRMLTGAFHWPNTSTLPFVERLRMLERLSDEWDFRRRATETEATTSGAAGARWGSPTQLLAEPLRSTVMAAAAALGLTAATLPRHREYCEILVLGGARLSCLLRARRAIELRRDGLVEGNIALLGSERPVAESERDATDSYAPGAQTEVDLFYAALEYLLGSGLTAADGETFDSPEPNLRWRIHRFRTEDLGTITITSAPSREPELRRANSADTYEFYVDRVGVEPRSRVLLVTSQQYVPYQQMEALRVLCVPKSLRVETIGFPPEWGGPVQGMAEPHNLLQEIRSFIQSSVRFATAHPLP